RGQLEAEAAGARRLAVLPGATAALRIVEVDLPVAVVVDAVVAARALRGAPRRAAARVRRPVDRAVAVVVDPVVALRVLARAERVRAAGVVGPVDLPVAVVVDPVAAARRPDELVRVGAERAGDGGRGREVEVLLEELAGRALREHVVPAEGV